MPRKVIGCKPKGKLKNWDDQSMMKAIVSVREKKMGLRKAVKLYHVPQTTLQRFVNSDKTPEECVNLKVGRKSVLPAHLETELVEHLVEMDNHFYGLRRDDVKRLAYQLAVRNNVPHPFLNETAGRAWFDLFIRRHKNRLTIHKPIGTSFSRANCFNKEVIDKLFNMLQTEYDKHPYPSDRVFNVDETGLTIVQSKIPHVVGLKGKRQVGAITSAERGSLVTVICCMSAGGTFVPPMLIFPRKNMTNALMRGAPPGSLGRCHPSGWIQTDLFTQWFNHFLQKTHPSEESPVLLILDGHNTHTRNLQIIHLARENHVTIVSIPPHTSHKTQPLDKSFMGPLKSYYSEYVRQFLRHNDRPVGPYDIAELFGKAYLQCQTGLIAASGFKVTGIYPCDRSVFKDVDFLPSGSSLETEPVQISGEHRSIQPPTTTSLQNTDISSCGPLSAAGIRDSHFRPSDIDLQEAGPSNQPAPCVSPRDIMPVPAPKRKTSNKGRKPSSAAVITSSPYKTALETVLKKPRNSFPKGKGKRKQTKTCKKKLVLEDKSDSDSIELSSGESILEMPVGEIPGEEADATCIFCGEAFSNDVQGELWIKCLLCESWCHTLCAGSENEHYICDFCK